MRIAFITRATLFDVPGGDTIQVLQTANHLRRLGWEVDIHRTNETIPYSNYSLLHFVNITRPSDILYHVAHSKKPFVVTPILIDYSEFDRFYRKGLSGFILRRFTRDTNEYIKTFSRWLSGGDTLRSKSYLWHGQRKSIRKILQLASALLPNSEAEYTRLKDSYQLDMPYSVVPNGVDTQLFNCDKKITKDNKLVVCAARIEGIKNQLNLIRALNNTDYTLVLIGAAAPNQQEYYRSCRKIAAKNVVFHDHVTQRQLVEYYAVAKVHALPSWFETCGLSSLEAGAMGCNLAITEKGFTRDYFGEQAFYADPGNVESIYKAVEAASNADYREELQIKIREQFTWNRAAAITAKAYEKILCN